MNESTEKKQGGSRRTGAIVLFILAAVLLIAAAAGYILRQTSSVKANLDQRRMSAVLHAASEGLVDKIAQEARADKLAELRKDKNFRKRGLDQPNSVDVYRVVVGMSPENLRRHIRNRADAGHGLCDMNCIQSL